MLIREAIQNSWDAKRANSPGISGPDRTSFAGSEQVRFCRDDRFWLIHHRHSRSQTSSPAQLDILYFADFGTYGLGGPTRADEVGATATSSTSSGTSGSRLKRSLEVARSATGKPRSTSPAAHGRSSSTRCAEPPTVAWSDDSSVARSARTSSWLVVPTRVATGGAEPSLGSLQPLTESAADSAAQALGLPSRTGPSEMGTTIVVIAPATDVLTEGGDDETMEFVAEAVAVEFLAQDDRHSRRHASDDGVPHQRR